MLLPYPDRITTIYFNGNIAIRTYGKGIDYCILIDKQIAVKGF